MSPHRSHWLRQVLATDTDVAPALAGEAKADVAIVGGGFCGLWTALELKALEPSLDVAIVERDICGGGASGRNAGYVINLWAKFPTLVDLCGSDGAVRLGRAAAAAVAEIDAFCRDHGIDAEYRPDGWLWGATCASQAGAWDPVLEALARHQLTPFQVLAAQEIASRWGIEGHVGGGVLEPSCATVHPAKLVRGLRRVALAQGVRIHENSPLVRLERGPRPRIVTAGGSLAAGTVVLAMNAWAAGFRELRGAFFVTAAEAAITAPVPELLAKMGWENGPAATDSRFMVANYRTTRDGRIEFGKGGGVLAFGGTVGAKYESPAHRLPLMHKEFHEAIPRLAGVAAIHSWVGPIDRSMAGVPLFSALPGSERVFFGVGFSGNGVGPSKVGGKILASLVLGVKDEWSTCGLVRPPTPALPGEPFRYLGGSLVRRAVMRKDWIDHAGGQADPITRALVALAPAGLTPTTTSRRAAS
ncbi:MAG: FAD-dependent oxidoreductase [Alphaproteobacteria bacterium]|nr:FAD-dependent oxidoreductase [Alphaproteobacteria bacterium]